MSLENKKEHLISSFLDSLYIEKGLSKNTASSYKNDISSFFLWLNNYSLNPLKVTTEDINVYVSKLFGDGLKSSSVNRKVSAIKSFYIFLLKKKIINKSPVAEITMPKKEKYLPISMSEEEVERLLNSPNLNAPIERRDKAMIEVLYATGIRISELINLKITDIDVNRSVLKVFGKGSKERLVPYGEKAADSINLYLKDRKHLKSKEIFLSNRGTRIQEVLFGRELKSILKEKILNYPFHHIHLDMPLLHIY